MRSPYRDHVPAVVRAVKALQTLAAAQQPQSLTALSRATNVSPSSLLAILTTLRNLGLVSRAAESAAYRPGPALVALGNAAAQCLQPLQQFDLLAGELVERFGETVILWIQQGDGFAMAAVREGSQPLRYVPALGLRLPATGWSASRDGLTEAELEPGVWLVATPLDEHALLALAGPSHRLKGAAGEAARTALRQTVTGEPALAGTYGGPIEPRELNAFLEQALVASLSYLSDDGYPASVPLWYDWDGRAFWLVPSPAAEWAAHVRRNPRVSLSISESTPPLRRVLARGPILAVDDPELIQWRSVEGRLAARYARLDPSRLLEGRTGNRTLFRLAPQQLIAWRGLVRPGPPGSALRTAQSA
jgi:DNA-binding HxlR family transcriptional regulator